MSKRKPQVQTLAEAAKAPKRTRRTKKEMEAARAQAFAIKRITVEATYPAQGYPISMCPVCISPFRTGVYKKRSLPNLELKHAGQMFSIHRPVYPCSTVDCKTDVICFISATLNQRDILWFLEPKRLKGGKDRQTILHSGPKLLPVRPQDASRNDQPNAQGMRGSLPDEALLKRKKIKRKQ